MTRIDLNRSAFFFLHVEMKAKPRYLGGSAIFLAMIWKWWEMGVNPIFLAMCARSLMTRSEEKGMIFPESRSSRWSWASAGLMKS